MPKITQSLTVNGKKYQTTIVQCGDCQKEIDFSAEPIVVLQSSLQAVHPDGYTEVIHIPNERNGRFEYFCKDCIGKAANPVASADEVTRLDEAVKRRAHAYPSA